jgi:hypothetical protein
VATTAWRSTFIAMSLREGRKETMVMGEEGFEPPTSCV